MVIPKTLTKVYLKKFEIDGCRRRGFHQLEASLPPFRLSCDIVIYCRLLRFDGHGKGRIALAVEVKSSASGQLPPFYLSSGDWRLPGA